MTIQFTKPVANINEPQGQIAFRLREVVTGSNIGTSAELRQHTQYARSTLSEALGGQKRQNRTIITRIVDACVLDLDERAAIIDELMGLLEQESYATTAVVIERPPGSINEPSQLDDPDGDLITDVDDDPDISGPERHQSSALHQQAIDGQTWPRPNNGPEDIDAGPNQPRDTPGAPWSAGPAGAPGAAAGGWRPYPSGDDQSGGHPDQQPGPTSSAPYSDPGSDPYRTTPYGSAYGTNPYGGAPADAYGRPGGSSGEGWAPSAGLPPTVSAPGLPGRSGPSGPPPPGTRRGGRSRGGGRRRSVVLATLAAVVVIAAAAFGVYIAQHPTCGPDIDRVDDQCIGISDGGVNIASDPAFDTLFAKIKAENDRILNAPDRAPVVSVAYVAPFNKNTATALATQLRQEIEGAYELQLQTNEAGGPNPLGGPPRVQLLIANLGESATQWPTVVDQLRARTTPGNVAPLVATIGIDQSVPAISDTIAALGRAQIPMVAARLVSDTISTDPVRDGFFAVAPSVNAQVSAAARLLASQSAQSRPPLLVEDTTQKDLYGRNVAQSFQRAFSAVPGAGTLPDPVPFDSQRPGLQAAFGSVLPAVCQLQPGPVFFAGRGTNLPDFIRALGTRICGAVPVTVYTASDGRILGDALRAEAANPAIEHQLAAAMKAGIRVVVTAQAHPGIWSYPAVVPPQSHAVLSGTYATAFPAQFPDQKQVDKGGDVIMGHDAMQVVVEAIRRGVPPQSTDPVTVDVVRQALGGITTYQPVYGASGPIAFRLAGYAIDKNIPVTEITPTGDITLLNPTAP